MLCVPKKEKGMKLKERAKKLKTDIPALVAITVRLIPKDVMEKICVEL